VLGAGGRQQRQGLAVEERKRAQVRRQLQVQQLRRQLADRRADADAGVVHQHVQAPERVAVGGDRADDVGLVADVGDDLLDLQAVVAQLLVGGRELLRAPGHERDRVALLGEHPGDREPNPAGGSRDDRGARVFHRRYPIM
jgi:hypothetical protein